MKLGDCYWVLCENGKIVDCHFQTYGDWDEKFFACSGLCSKKIAGNLNKDVWKQSFKCLFQV